MIRPGAILLMGRPGSGKGTQAFRLARHLPNFVHFDTGGEIYRRITDPAFADDLLVQEQKKIYFTGKLNQPKWVAALVAERIREYAREGRGIILSGSPRTPAEARALLPLLIESYGKERLLGIELEISSKEMQSRSLLRITCANKSCRYPAKRGEEGTPCPNCGQALPAEIQTDEQWKTAGIETRLQEFQELTVPAAALLKKEIQFSQVDGSKTEEEVFSRICAAVQERLGGRDTTTPC